MGIYALDCERLLAKEDVADLGKMRAGDHFGAASSAFARLLAGSEDYVAGWIIVGAARVRHDPGSGWSYTGRLREKFGDRSIVKYCDLKLSSLEYAISLKNSNRDNVSLTQSARKKYFDCLSRYRFDCLESLPFLIAETQEPSSPAPLMRSVLQAFITKKKSSVDERLLLLRAYVNGSIGQMIGYHTAGQPAVPDPKYSRGNPVFALLGEEGPKIREAIILAKEI